MDTILTEVAATRNAQVVVQNPENVLVKVPSDVEVIKVRIVTVGHHRKIGVARNAARVRIAVEKMKREAKVQTGATDDHVSPDLGKQ